MFARVKKAGPYQYLQIVENRREGRKTRQRVIATVGRMDELEARGQIENLVRSLSRFSEKLLLVLSGKCDAHASAKKIGPVLIFERLKEELRSGRPLQQAIDLGWSRAWPSIRDSNSSTLITCVILFIFGNTFGASMVKGFSINLALGVLISLFTAIIVTRTFLHLVLDNLKLGEHPRWFGL